MEKESKKIKMTQENKNEKLSYEQLEQIANNLNHQCRVYQQQLMQAQGTIAEFNEIGMLLDVLKQSEHFTPGFTERCSSKIEDLITRALDDSEKPEGEQK